MVVFPPVTVRQPRPHDIVDDPVGICSVGTGFEGWRSSRRQKDGSGRELNKVVVPIVFGRALIDPYNGFAQYTVEPGDTLSSIAEQFLGDADRSRAIFQANRDQIEDPDLIFSGQVLRVPQ